MGIGGGSGTGVTQPAKEYFSVRVVKGSKLSVRTDLPDLLEDFTEDFGALEQQFNLLGSAIVAFHPLSQESGKIDSQYETDAQARRAAVDYFSSNGYEATLNSVHLFKRAPEIAP